jgi:phosphoribosylformylglycinamidine cyclo-ligase
MMDKYDTVGIDCIAMNVNDILCVGAEPISMVDYIAICDPDPKLMDEIGKGLAKGAEISNITISGGEIAIVKDMVKGVGKNREFDLVGTAIGTVDKFRFRYKGFNAHNR